MDWYRNWQSSAGVPPSWNLCFFSLLPIGLTGTEGQGLSQSRSWWESTFQATDVKKLWKGNTQEAWPLWHFTSLSHANRTNNSAMAISASIFIVVAEKHRFHRFHSISCQESLRERHLAVYRRLAPNFFHLFLFFLSFPQLHKCWDSSHTALLLVRTIPDIHWNTPPPRPS